MNTTLLTQILQFVIGVAALIILHEFGHYIVARLAKVEVEEFGIGFPPRIVKLFEAGGTEFTLNAIPLGGFVRPRGENDPSVPGGLAAASPWTRLAVLFAGPTMNILTGIVLAVLLFYRLGEPVLNQVILKEVAAGSPAEQAGLRPGDRVVEVNGVKIENMEQLVSEIGSKAGQSIQITYLRDGQTATTGLTPRASPPPGQGPTGIVLDNPRQPVGWGTAIQRGASLAYENARGILLLPVKLIQGNAAPEEGRLVGFKGMFDIYQQIPDPLYFFMAISISLGVLNLFPIPALDGGRILLTLPEILLRRRIPPQYENMIHLVGFTLLLLLIIYINIQDFINPLQFGP